MVKIWINNGNTTEIGTNNYEEVVQYVTGITNIQPADFYLEQNGKLLREHVNEGLPIYVRIRLLAGKGGFGSMLRAIGAQIEKTTNREACRDLSGRRLRDINEEKRLKAWLEKQGERERESEERKKRKIEKLLAVPKHEFKDEQYEKARSKLTEKVCDAVEEGFKNAEACSSSDLKRKHQASTSQQAVKAKKKKPGLWLDDLSSGSDYSDGSDDSDASVNEDKKKKSLDKTVEKCSDDDNLTEDKLSDKDSESSVSLASK